MIQKLASWDENDLVSIKVRFAKKVARAAEIDRYLTKWAERTVETCSDPQSFIPDQDGNVKANTWAGGIFIVRQDIVEEDDRKGEVSSAVFIFFLTAMPGLDEVLAKHGMAGAKMCEIPHTHTGDRLIKITTDHNTSVWIETKQPPIFEGKDKLKCEKRKNSNGGG